MKNLKKMAFLIISALLIIACEKDEIIEKQPEGQLNNLDKPISLSNLIESGYFENYNKNQSQKPVQKSVPQAKVFNAKTGVTFYFDEEEFNNQGNTNFLTVEDFDDILFESSYFAFTDPLDENTNNGVISPNDISTGIVFSTPDNFENELIIGNSYFSADSNILGANYFVDNLEISFTNSDVKDVSFDIFSIWSSSNIEIKVYDESGLIDVYALYVSNYGNFLGISSFVPIKKITLNSITNEAEFVDNVRFGTIIRDQDNDGILDNVDPYPYSILDEYVSVDGCETSVENIFVEDGTTMMDKINALIQEANAQYNGENWEEVHKDFVREVSKLTSHWRYDRIISRRERSQITGCAWRSSIPQYNI